jgi:hypothetical protein
MVGGIVEEPMVEHVVIRWQTDGKKKFREVLIRSELQ